MLRPSFIVTAQDERDDYARLILEPLEKGYGNSLGVGLRRVLLSSIESAAVVRVQIDEVQHQYTTLKGMKEDVTELILNVKQLNFKLEGSEEVVVHLEASGSKTVTGADITLPTGVVLANPDQKLAVLANSKSKLSMDLTIANGRGYSPASDRTSSTLGDIPIDATFSPVVKVAYKVEQTRVGRLTDFDKLIMDIHTDGTISPKVALEKAAQILVDHFNQIVNPVIIEAPKETSLEDRIENEVLKLTVEELDLPTRIANALRKGGYKTVKDLTEGNRSQVAKVKNLGEKSVDSVGDALIQKGLNFKAE